MAHIKRFIFTLNQLDNHNFPKPEIIRSALSQFCSEAVFQLESGVTTSRLHYQGRFETVKRTSAKAARLKMMEHLEIEDGTPLTIKRETTENSEDYCTKSETRVEGPWYAGTSAYQLQENNEELPDFDWCKQVLKLLGSSVGKSWKKRKVVVFYDTKGGNGKSSFVRFLSRNNKYKFHKIPIDNPDRARHGICKWVTQHEVDGFTFNLQRTRSKDSSLDSMFEVIEDVKDAHVTSFFGGTNLEVVFNYPWVFIFTNEDPKTFKSKLSHDRWIIFSIYQGKMYNYDDIDLGLGQITPLVAEDYINNFES